MSLIRRFVEWVVSGLGLGIGLAAGTLIMATATTSFWRAGPDHFMEKHMAEQEEQQAEMKRKMIQNPNDLALSNFRPVRILRHAAINAEIQNKSTERVYQHVEGELTLSDDSGILHTCDVRATVGELGPGDSKVVSFSCHEVEQSSVPAAVQYQLKLTVGHTS